MARPRKVLEETVIDTDEGQPIVELAAKPVPSMLEPAPAPAKPMPRKGMIEAQVTQADIDETRRKYLHQLANLLRDRHHPSDGSIADVIETIDALDRIVPAMEGN